MEKKLVQTFNEIKPIERQFAGGKGGILAQLYQAGYPVPDGLVVLPSAFEGDELTAPAWEQLKLRLTRLHNGDANSPFAVRSSARSEDSALASFAGEFETILDVRGESALRLAIESVRRSGHHTRVRAYAEAQGLDTRHEVAVIVQRLVPAEFSGVLFTADPLSGSHSHMTGNYVRGLGERLVSGEVNPEAFRLAQPKGDYEGPAEFAPYARDLYRLARRLVRELGAPQDIEWAIAGEKLYLLQSRPITTLRADDSLRGEINDSLLGDYLWSNANLSEATPDVMTPLTWSLWRIFHEETALPIPDHPLVGNICGRPYGNVSLGVSLYLALGKDKQGAIEALDEAMGAVPSEIEVPTLPLSRFELLRAILPGIAKRIIKALKYARQIPRMVDRSPTDCQWFKTRLQGIYAPIGLVAEWRNTLYPAFMDWCWMVRISAKRSFEQYRSLHDELVSLVGEADANALLAVGGDDLASLGPLKGLEKVQRGEWTEAQYLERYGHRGPHEMELSIPHPVEDPHWLAGQLAEMRENPVDVNALLATQQAAFEAAWKRLRKEHPQQAEKIYGRIQNAAQAARQREAVRSEFTRFAGVVRAFALRAGELTGLRDGVFFLSFEELVDYLVGNEEAAGPITARQETHARYCALPPYPGLIRGRFDPYTWAADPGRRYDVYDAQAPLPVDRSKTVRGFPGAAGRVEGRVRRLDSPEESAALQPGEILVAVTTNVGWTPLFPRAGAVVTDVGAPLSHAAIVARELGIPAVVGCGDATTRLHTGDLVRVDGAQGTVELIK